MACQEYQELISDYIDGTLELGEEARIERHLADCDGCRAVRDDLLQIVHFSRQLPLHTPSSEVWTQLQTKIAAERPTHFGSRVAAWVSRLKNLELNLSVPQLAASAAALLIIFSVALIISRQSAETPSASSLAGRSGTAGMNLLSNAEDQEIEEKIERLRESVEQRRVTWSPELQVAYDRSIRQVDQCLATCRQQLSGDPSDQVSKDLMRDAYLEKQRLLEGFTKF
ncbi:MAG TPA: zf-HC2 domain-containing protein [Blastocatellia bacterium]|nr:zf-HC2 domain-containing protein [Blastocatellia bacterium]